MVKWEEIIELKYILSELTSDIMIFLIYLNEIDEENFKKIHTKITKDM